MNWLGPGGTRQLIGPGGTQPLIGPGGEQRPVIPPLGPGGTQQIFDFSISNLVLMIGGQIFILLLLLFFVFFGTPVLSSPARIVRSIGINSKITK